jgi:DNA-binding SARP family transcriptional activator
VRASANPLPGVQSLIDRVLEAVPRTVLLTAPAGYGKSTFVQSYGRTFERAVVCDCDGVREGEALGRRIVDALTSGSVEAALEAARTRLAQGTEPRAELDVVRAFWGRSSGRTLFVFENADGLRDVAGAHELIERLVVAAPADRTLAFCSRRPLPSAFTRAIGSRGVVRIEAADLELGFDEVVRLAVECGVAADAGREIARLSAGWAMVARLLVAVALAGKLDELVMHLDDIAFEELYDYLADQVVAALPQPVFDALLVAAAVPAPTAADVRVVLGDRFDALTELRLLALPFVDSGGPVYGIHPLVRSMVVARYRERVDDALQRALNAHERRGNAARAAQIALAQGDARRAARVLDRLPTYLRTSAALPDCEQVVSRLGTALIAQFPNLWIATIPFRRFSVDLETYLDEARTVYYCLPPECGAGLRVDALLQLASALYQNGIFVEAEELLGEALATFAASPSDERAALLTFVASLRGLQGRFSEARALRAEAASIRRPDFLADLGLNYVDAHEAIARGRYEAGIAIIDESLRRMKEARLPLYIAFTATNGAIFAWANGDDARCTRFVGEVEEAMISGIERGFASLLAGARGRPFSPDPHFESPVALAMAQLYRMGHGRTNPEKAQAARAAAAEADRCRDPYVQVLAHAACALLLPERHAEATALLDAARRIESPELLAAAESIAHGQATYGILEPYVCERVRGARVVGPSAVTVQVFAGRVVISGREIRLAGKEFELLLYLAYARGTAARGAIVEAIWPLIDDEDDGWNNLRVTLSRLRRKLGDERFVIRHDGGYRLSPEVAVDVREAERLVRECGTAVALDERQRLELAAFFAQIEASGFGSRLERFAWFAPHRLRLRELAFASGTLIARDAFARGDTGDALRYARSLAELDPLDEGARALVLQILVARGERDAARREFDGYAALLHAELDTEPSPELVKVVEAGRVAHRPGQRPVNPLQRR